MYIFLISEIDGDDLERFMRYGPILFARFSDSNTQTATNSAFNAVGSNGKVSNLCSIHTDKIRSNGTVTK